MLKLRKSKPQFEVIRAEDLQVGDQFVWDHPVIVKEIKTLDARQIGVTIENVYNSEFDMPTKTQTVEIYREVLIRVLR